MAADMCVSVAKYSHALGLNPDNTIPWIHHTASDIFLVLKGEDTHVQNGRLIMQVVQGNAALETINVGDLVDMSIEARNGSQRAGITPQIEQLPIFGIHKAIFLALRYRSSGDQARRVQFKLNSAQDCVSMIEVLKRRGMEFQQQRPRTARSTTARPDTSGSQERPLTALAVHSATHAFVAPADPGKPSPIRMPVLEAGGLSSHHSGSMGGPVPAVKRPPIQTLLPFSAHSTPSKETFRSATPYDTGKQMVAQHFPHSHAVLLGPTDDGSARSCNTSNQMHLVSTPSLGFDKPVNEHLSKASALLSKQKNPQVETRDIAPSSSDNRSSLFRPSLPPSLRMPETLEHEMPPRRELPFKRPGSHQSSSSRPSTISKSLYSPANIGSSDPPVLSSTSSPARQFGVNRPATASPLKSVVAPNVTQPVAKEQSFHTRPQSHASTLPETSYVKSSAKTIKAATPQSTFRRPSDLGELLRISKPSSGGSTTSNKASRMDSTADAAYELDTPPGTSSSLSKPNAHQPPGVGLLSDFFATQAVVGEAASLADYASQSREDRQTVLDEFMISKLEDPNFAVLCEDLDTCWRKIALGL